MKLFSYILLLCLAYHSFGQVLQPQPLPCLILNQPEVDILYNSGGISHPECIETVSTLNFDPTVSYSVKAGDHITFKEGAYLAPNSSNQYHAYIEQSAFDLAWYGPSQSGTVGQFEKLEIGLQFEDAINDEILNFVNDLSGNKLNPFNPDEIDVYAEFFYSEPGVGYGAAQRINGFYYEEVTREVIGHTEVSVDHNIRFRFTPRKLGSYKCQITAIVAGHGTYHAAPFYFGCVPSTEEDFMRVGDNGHYFKVGDESFFPVGHNLVWPLPDNHKSTTISYPQVTKNGYETNLEMIDSIKYWGGNYFRLINAPWSTDVEFEELGNYSERMGHAWELDQIIQRADNLDLRIHFNNHVHYTLETPNTLSTYWDWPAFGDTPASSVSCFSQNDNGYCYNSIPGVQGPEDFFTNPTAIAYYKKRLRYIIARWGYAPEIAIFELFSEIPHAGRDLPVTANPNFPGDSSKQCHFEGTPYKPYLSDISFPQKIHFWHEEMANFIKTDLGHTNHLIGVNYSDPINEGWADGSYQSAVIDVNSRNYYRESVDNLEVDYNETQTHYNKGPYMHSEYGPGGPTHDCDGETNYIKNYLMTPFVGLASTGLAWDFLRPGETHRWRYMGVINDFMEGINLDEENWTVGEPFIRDDKAIEMYYLRTNFTGTNSPQKAVGAVSNRTYNYYTQSTGPDCSVISNELNDYPIYQNYMPISYYGSGSQIIKIPNMGTTKDYLIDWYDGLSGNFIQTSTETSGVFGKLEIIFPGYLGNQSNPILLFQVYPQGSTFKSSQTINAQSIDEERVSEQILASDEIDLVKISPNPTKGRVTISTTSEHNDFTFWTITNANGQILNSGEINTTNLELDLSVYQRGVYFIRIDGHEDSKNFKIIRQ